jgi:hypothetical protein
MIPDESTRAEIEAAVRHLYGSYLEFNTDAVESGNDEDSTVWDLWHPPLVRGAAERAALRSADIAVTKQRGKLSIAIEPPVVTVHGPVAVARYYLDFAFEPPNATSGRVRVTTVFERQNGAWKRVHHHEGINPEGRPPLIE